MFEGRVISTSKADQTGESLVRFHVEKGYAGVKTGEDVTVRMKGRVLLSPSILVEAYRSDRGIESIGHECPRPDIRPFLEQVEAGRVKTSLRAIVVHQHNPTDRIPVKIIGPNGQVWNQSSLTDVPLGAYRAEVDTPRYRMLSTTGQEVVAGSCPVLQVQVEGTLTLRGKLRNHDGSVAKNVGVFLDPTILHYGANWRASVDSEGRYEITKIPPGNYRVLMRHGGPERSLKTYYPDEDRIENAHIVSIQPDGPFQSNGIRTLDLTLPPPVMRTVRLRILGWAQAPVANADIQVKIWSDGSQRSGVFRSGASGVIDLRLQDGARQWPWITAPGGFPNDVVVELDEHQTQATLRLTQS